MAEFGQGYSATQSAMRLRSTGQWGSDMLWEHNGVDAFMIYSAGPSMDFWRLGPNQAIVLTCDAATGVVTFPFGSQNASDASLKTPHAPEASTDDALQMLKDVSARVYERLDDPGPSRLGFIAQEVMAACPDSKAWGNLIGTATIGDDPRGSQEREIKTLDYARLVCVLWQCNRSMLARIEALEARLP